MFLDEVAEMSPAMQAALLRVVETNTFRRVGDVGSSGPTSGSCARPAATWRRWSGPAASARTCTTGSRARQVRIPPLRERTDVSSSPATCSAAAPSCRLGRATRSPRTPGPATSASSSRCLRSPSSPPAGAGWIEPCHLPPELGAAQPDRARLARRRRARRAGRALAVAGGNVSLARAPLGVARSTVHRMKRRYGLGQLRAP
ncbi:MAG: sigma 54-interacting transcriptional regulator [Myxococcales bacterium]|nr:sigma 54-interacting transcriptional regulator [Myxococcales bacterium]